MEGVSRILGDTPHWFQLYWSRSDELVEQPRRARAERCGCRAIVITLDTTMLGWRTRDLEGAFLPFLRGQGHRPVHERPGVHATDHRAAARADASSRAAADPGRAPHADRAHAAPIPDSFWRTLRTGRGRAAVQRFTEIYSRPSLTWETLAFLRERTELPIVLKGILHPDDARPRASTRAMDGMIVSNHGGRQVDGAIATLDALPGGGRGGGRPDPGAARLRRARRGGRLQGARARRPGRPDRPPLRVRPRRSPAATACGTCY